MTLLDTSALPPRQRSDAIREAIESCGVPTDLAYHCAAEAIGTRMTRIQLGAISMVQIAGSAHTLRRTDRHLRMVAPEQASLTFHIKGGGVATCEDRERIETVGELYLRDLTCPFAVRLDEGHVTVSTHISYAQLALPPDLIRRRAPLLRASPLHNLVRDHLTRVSMVSDGSLITVSSLLGTATTDLIRALIASAGDADAWHGEVMQQSLKARVVAYVQQHLQDRDLCADTIARANHVSPRQLYKLWSTNTVSLEQWIIAQRLEGARRDITAPAARSDTITVIAHRWGFADSTHFSRRFRAAFGMSPREWRALQDATAASRAHSEPGPPVIGKASRPSLPVFGAPVC